MADLSTTNMLGGWDFSKIANLWKNANETSAVTTDGDVILSVTDSSGNGKHVEQSSANRGPVYKASIQNSLSVGRWPNPNDSATELHCNSHTIVIGTSFTVYIVGKLSSSVTRAALCGSDAFDQATQIFQMNWPGDGTNQTLRVQTYTNTPQTAQKDMGFTASAFHIFTLVRDGSNLTVYIDGTSGGSTALTGTPATATQGMTLGGNQLVGTSNLVGDIGEAAIYSTADSLATVRANSAILNTKWGLGIAGLGSGGGAQKGGSAKSHGGRGRRGSDTGGAESHLIGF